MVLSCMKKFDELFFGTSGIPLTTQRPDTVNGIGRVKELGLHAMELEFVQSVNIKEEKAPLVKAAAEKNGVTLTCHGQYFINLNSIDKKKLEASKERVYHAAKRAYQCGAWSMCFHPAFYQGRSSKETYATVKQALSEVLERLKSEGVNIWVRPETTGKPTQFGSLEELVQLSLELENVLPCIDFSHLYARSNGKYNSTEEFSSVLEFLEDKLGKDYYLKNMHAHVQGVEFTEKGERRHLPFSESGFNYRDLVKVFKDYSAKGIVICESPLMEEDTLILQKAYKKA